MKKGLSIRQIAKLVPCERNTAEKYIAIDGIKPIGKKSGNSVYAKSAVESIRKHVKPKQSKEPNIDPETGLTWAQRETKERALQLARENNLAKKVEAGEWLPVTAAQSVLSAYINRIEQLPGKLKSETGLNDLQTAAMRKALDDARNDASEEILKFKAEL